MDFAQAPIGPEMRPERNTNAVGGLGSSYGGVNQRPHGERRGAFRLQR